ncbi:MAG: PAS domain-containing protein [Rhodospirillaceae bacterium]|nr:PAS domain-containing protein [Rhodospirillaceae bacterium]
MSLGLTSLIPRRGPTRGDARAKARDDFFLRAFESGALPRMITDADGRAVHANRAFHERFDCTAGDPYEAMVAALAAGEGGRETMDRLRAAAAAGSSAHGDFPVLDGAGRRAWYAVQAHPLEASPSQDDSGFILWRIEEITARREMEQIIRDEQRKLFDFFENAPIGFYSLDGEGRFLFVNNTFAEWLGHRVEEIVGTGLRLHDLIGDELPPGTSAHVPFSDPGGVERGEAVFVARDGRRFLADITQSVVEGEDGIWTRTVVRDLSRERAMEEALERSRQRFRRIFEDAPVGIALLDQAGTLRESNGSFRAIVGRRLLDGLPLTDLVAAEDKADAQALLAAVGEGRDCAQPLEARLAGSGDRVLALYANQVGDGEGAGVAGGMVVHALDTTEQKALEVQFAQSQKMQAVGQLAGGIAHDFNNLLTAMIGFCDLLLLRFRPGEQSFADVMQIKQNANRAANLVRQLLAFSRQQTLQPKILNLTDVLAELSHLLRRLIGGNIVLDMVHGRDLGEVRGDQGQFEQVAINLAVNARDAMPEGGTLTIRTSNVARDEAERHGHELLPAGDYVLIEVVDSGVGIAKENIGRVFEPFFTTKEVGSGTGLGLATVYGIVKQTGGYIFLDSAPGAGARFSIYLPRHLATETEARADRGGGGDLRQDLSGAGTVLLVEDEDPVRMFGARALRNKGYKVLEAKSGEEALEIFSTSDEPIDLLITDVVMPRMDGPSLIMRVREQAPETRIICISGYAEEAFRKRLDSCADIHFLPKPFSLKQLAGKVKEVMRGRA